MTGARKAPAAARAKKAPAAARSTKRTSDAARRTAQLRALKAENKRLAAELRARTEELTESLEQQTATSEVLGAISSSPGELQPVFETILANALRICEAAHGVLWRFEHGALQAMAHQGLPAELGSRLSGGPIHPGANSPPMEMARARTAVTVADLRETQAYRDRDPAVTAMVELGGVRTVALVPMLKDGTVVGAINVHRREARPFTDKQIALLENFAAQAVIAIENAQLLGELRDSLARQTATLDVLGVVSSSLGELKPVFGTMLDHALRLCDAHMGFVLRYADGAFEMESARGVPPAFAENDSGPLRPVGQGGLAEMLATKAPVQERDFAMSDAYRMRRPHAVAFVERGRARTVLFVPMLKDGAIVGCFGIYRPEVHLFGQREIALVENFAGQAVIAIENARLLNELRQSLQQQTATADVLKVISRSAFDLQRVFETVAESAVRLCEAELAFIFRFDGEMLHAAATFNASPALRDFVTRNPIRPGRYSGTARCALERRTIHIPDVTTDPEYTYGARGVDPIRTVLAVPMLKGDELLGVILLYRLEVKPFADRQVALVETFADQAAIAIENVRLLSELRESLEYQTATSDLLNVISRSGAEIVPVLDMLVATAARLCAADMAFVLRRDGELYRAASSIGYTPEYQAFMQAHPLVPGRGSITGRVALEGRIVHVADVAADPDYALPAIEMAKQRTALGVPLLREGEPLGVIVLARRRVEPFTERQIELVRTFADQAVIAIENARLLTELRDRTHDLEESLEYQTATSELLQLISRSTFDLQPVLEAIVEAAGRLCAADAGHLALREGDDYRTAALFAPTPDADALVRGLSYHPGRGTAIGRALLERRVIQIEDVIADADHSLHRSQPASSLVRTIVGVPLMREGEPIGALGLWRARVEPFSDRQIELLRTFADQAVIAIENARLLTELRESLENQTATADILRVIASTPGDSATALDAIAATAARMFDASSAIIRRLDGNVLRVVCAAGPAAAAVRSAVPDLSLDHAENAGLSVREARQIHVADRRADSDWGTELSDIVRDLPIRTQAFTPLLREGAAIGTMIVNRDEVRPFQTKELELMKGFADQAVIAIENARLLTELRESLDRQTATSEVLSVISSSPGQLKPVFDAMIEKAMHLCTATFGYLMTYDGGRFEAVAHRGLPPRFAAYLPTMDQPGSSGAYARIIAGAPFVHVADLMEGDVYLTSPLRRALVDLGGARTGIIVPLRKDQALLGVITVYRQEVRPFGDDELGILQNFAAQAVIAIENARLLTELREALENQTATAEVLGVISSSPGDLKPVFEAIAESATRLCGADFCIAARVEERGRLSTLGRHNMPPALEQYFATAPSLPPPDGHVSYERETLHIPDLAVHGSYLAGNPLRVALVDRGGVHTLLRVPMLKDGEALGFIGVNRTRIEPFTDKQVTLVENFAAQAVIAIENARLLSELRASLDRQTATSEVLSVISSSPTELAPVFEVMLDRAMRLCTAEFGTLFLYRDGIAEFVGVQGAGPLYAQHLKRTPLRPGGGTLTGDLVATVRTVQFPDYRAERSYLERNPVAVAAVELGGARTALGVPMTKEGKLVGGIILWRQDVRPFDDKQIALVENFAAQAVIAVENARLLAELRGSLDRQTATADILRVIASTPGDPTRALDTIAETASRMFEAPNVHIRRLDGDMLRIISAAGTASGTTRSAMRDVPFDQSAGGGRCMIENRQIHVEDTTTFATGTPIGRLARDLGIRTQAFTPLTRDGKAIGAMIVNRTEHRPFRPDELELMRGFADQAVIAIENARLLSELRERTDELGRREAELRVTFDNMGDGVVMFDAEHRLVSWNRNLQEILSIPDAFLAEPRSYRDYIAYLIGRGEFGAVDFESELRRYTEAAGREQRLERTRPDGHVIEARVNPVPGGGFVLIYSDITERKRAEEQIRAARDAAEQALAELKTAQASLIQAEKMASLGQLTAGIAHEIKNPLNFVNNFAGLSVELLDELKEAAAPALTALDEDRRGEIDEVVAMLTGNLAKIAEHGRRADGIVKSMLAHSRGGSSERQTVNLAALVEESLNLAYHGARAQDQNFNITLERDFDPSIAPLEVVPQDITRVFLNLFGNGFYAANKRRAQAGDPAFKPVLKVTIRDQGEDVAVQIRDNGTGIPPEIRAKLFEPFFTTKPTGEGTGLGLSISYEIVTQQHGGTIEVESEVGAFTEFTIRLPRRFGAATAGRS